MHGVDIHLVVQLCRNNLGGAAGMQDLVALIEFHGFLVHPANERLKFHADFRDIVGAHHHIAAADIDFVLQGNHGRLSRHGFFYRLAIDPDFLDATLGHGRQGDDFLAGPDNA